MNVVSDEFGSEPNDGLMGMGFGTIASSKKPTFFENLLLTHAIETPIFSVHLERGKEDGSQVSLKHDSQTPRKSPMFTLLDSGLFRVL